MGGKAGTAHPGWLLHPELPAGSCSRVYLTTAQGHQPAAKLHRSRPIQCPYVSIQQRSLASLPVLPAQSRDQLWLLFQLSRKLTGRPWFSVYPTPLQRQPHLGAHQRWFRWLTLPASPRAVLAKTFDLPGNKNAQLLPLK